jgi:uncharacterized RDD family membrane protein YckC
MMMTDPTRYAGLVARFVALVIDTLLFCAVFFPITRMVKGVWLMGASDHRWVSGWFVSDPLCMAFFVVIAVYYVGLEAYAGATVGKWALGLRVIGPDGARPGLSRSLLRNAGRLIDTLPALNILGVILILRSPQNARFGDRIADTRVVHVR